MSQTRESFEDYDGFVEKFKPKRTTDDCYTPPEIYAVVLDYVRERWGVDEADVVRPFWPGGDFEAFDYPEGCVVVDNPPFSILARIQAFYLERGIRFFLFAPSLTCLSGRRCMEVDHIVCDCSITYENGAVVRTGFVTNLDGENVLEAEPELGRRLNEANDARLAATRKTVAKYEYPDDVITAARAQWFAAHGTPYRVRRRDACRIPALDEQRGRGKAIFGGCLLLSRAAGLITSQIDTAPKLESSFTIRDNSLITSQIDTAPKLAKCQARGLNRLITSQIDTAPKLFMDGEWHYWDMKTLEGGLSALRKRMGECYSKWVRLSERGATLQAGIDLNRLDNPRVVVDNRYSKIADVDAEKQIAGSMKYLSGKGKFSFSDAMLILKDGTTKLIK